LRGGVPNKMLLLA